MPLILNIDTALESASICLSNNSTVIAFAESNEQKNHASFVQPAIKKIFEEANLKLNDIDAVSVSNGPGSYTGLRVGLASAKGICYALQKPLITLNTLDVLAHSIAETYTALANNDLPVLYCPMIDARRMEVFTALYNNNFIPFNLAAAVILKEDSFQDILSSHQIVFGGSGAGKFKEICNHQNAEFVDINSTAKNMITIAEYFFIEKKFADIAYAEPNYTKDVYIK